MRNVDNISLIIPVYNEEIVIKKTLENLININLKGEIILVNNSCTDKTFDIVDNFIANISDKNYINKKIIKELKQGYGYSLITGINNASYETILI